jgi:hypothetical protein
MRDEPDRALDQNPDYPPGFDLRGFEDALEDPELDVEAVFSEDLE